jgi:hypothetical protein
MHQHSRSNCVAVLRLKTGISSGSSSRMERTAILKLAMYLDTGEISRSQSSSTKSRCVISLTTGPFSVFCSLRKYQNAEISSNQQWARVCGSTFADAGLAEASRGVTNVQAAFTGAVLCVLLFGVLSISNWIRRSRAQSRLRLPGDEVSSTFPYQS